MSIILVMQVSLPRTIVCGVKCFTIMIAAVRAAAMCQIRSEDKDLTWSVFVSVQLELSFGSLTRFQLNRLPGLLFHPVRLRAIVPTGWHIHLMAALDYLQTSVCRIGGIDCQQDGKMFNVLDVSVCCGIDMRRKSTCPGLSKDAKYESTPVLTHHFLRACN